MGRIIGVAIWAIVAGAVRILWKAWVSGWTTRKKVKK